VSSIHPAALAAPAASSSRPRVRGGTFVIFLAALGPMLTVPALRKLLMEEHGATPAGVHMFVAVGMIGSALGAPLVAAHADRKGDHIRIAMLLAAIDALVAVITSSHVPTGLLYALRPVHGLASMGLLALLFGEFRRSRAELVAYAGGAMVAALAIGPAVGGALTRLGPHVPFRAAAVVSLVVAVLMANRLGSPAEAAVAPSAPEARCERATSISHGLLAPLVIVMTQRFAIGGLVTAFAVHARAVHHLTDAHVGASFSLLLVVFAAAVFTLGRKLTGRALASCLPAGAALFGASLAALSVVPRPFIPVALVGAGLGAALVYAPCLDLVSAAAPGGRRATSMALLHSAGAVGMILGPITAALLEVVLAGASAPQRCAVFMAFAGVLHAAVSIALSARCRAIAAASTTTVRTTSE
jgi:MFS family permease